jgi:hypothetical protein
MKMENDILTRLLSRLHFAYSERRRREMVREILGEVCRVQMPHPEMDLHGFWAFGTELSSESLAGLS